MIFFLAILGGCVLGVKRSFFFILILLEMFLVLSVYFYLGGLAWAGGGFVYLVVVMSVVEACVGFGILLSVAPTGGDYFV